eukprot:3166383-Amphidinium_carterae.2
MLGAQVQKWQHSVMGCFGVKPTRRAHLPSFVPVILHTCVSRAPLQMDLPSATGYPYMLATPMQQICAALHEAFDRRLLLTWFSRNRCSAASNTYADAPRKSCVAVCSLSSATELSS